MTVSFMKIEADSTPIIQVAFCTSSIGQCATEYFHIPLWN